MAGNGAAESVGHWLERVRLTLRNPCLTTVERATLEVFEEYCKASPDQSADAPTGDIGEHTRIALEASKRWEQHKPAQDFGEDPDFEVIGDDEPLEDEKEEFTRLIKEAKEFTRLGEEAQRRERKQTYAKAPPAITPPLVLRHLPFDEFLSQPASSAEKLSTYVYAGCLTIFAGEPGGTKSWLLLHEALEIARSGKPVLYIALEGHMQKLQRRIDVLTLEDDREELRKHLHISFMPGVTDAEGGKSFKLSDPEWVTAVITELSRPEFKPVAGFIDPLADAVDGDADREVEMRPAKDGLKRLRQELNIALGLGHHTVKSAWTDSVGAREVKPSKAHARGSGAWLGTTEISVDVTPTEAQTEKYGESLVTLLKARDFPDVPTERVFTVTDTPTEDGQTVVATALQDPKEVRSAGSRIARYRTKAIDALATAPDGALTKAELLKAIGLDGKTGGTVLRALSGHLGALKCVTGDEAKALDFHPNAHVYLRKGMGGPSVSETPIPRHSETPRPRSTAGGMSVSEFSKDSDTHTQGASNDTHTSSTTFSETSPPGPQLKPPEPPATTTKPSTPRQAVSVASGAVPQDQPHPPPPDPTWPCASVEPSTTPWDTSTLKHCTRPTVPGQIYCQPHLNALGLSH